MTFRIERTRGPVSARPANDHAADADESSPSPSANLPVPVGPSARPPKAEKRGGQADFSAQLLGQDGQKRGLRAGQPLLETAKRSYHEVEWSGSKDRRARKGRKAKTEV